MTGVGRAAIIANVVRQQGAAKHRVYHCCERRDRKKQHVRCGKILRNEGEVITRRLEATAGARIAPETWQMIGKQHVMATKCLSDTSQDWDRKVKGFSETL